MTEQDYKNETAIIEAEYNNKIKALNIKYAKSQEKFKIGDIIKDDRWAFKIDKITCYVSFGKVEPVYHGVELKKDLTPKKNNNRVCIYGNRDIVLVK